MRKTFRPAVATAFTAAAILAAASLVANAQTPPAPNTTQKPAAKPGGDNSKTEPLSKKLDKNEGVLKPPTGVDPGIHEQPPRTGDKMPIIVPPGEPGGDQSVQPK